MSLALLAVLVRQTDLSALAAAIADADGRWLLAAWIAMILSQVVSAYRWAILARAVGFHEPFGRFVLYYFSGMYLNLFGPGTVAGDIGRVVFLAGGRRRALALTSVVAHRASGLVALLWIAGAGVALVPDHPFPGIVRPIAALVVPMTIAGWIWGPRLAARVLPPANRWRLLVERDLAPYWRDRALLALVLGWAVAMHAIQIGAQFAVAQAIGLRLPWAFFLIAIPLINIAGTLPFSFQGIGVREAGYWAFLRRIGVQREAALATAVLTSALIIATGLTGLPALLLLDRTRHVRVEADVER